ncbi:DUF4157 domain-containing protein [Pseudorhodoferax soli]|uniref:Uncharacterized protein DUF4157 n=1 Tax=Pseudorhodoferax soli TaxID=545864 RepID=A0A368Y8L7_9BURK|nr:DUF4157 domain-containing protein [Pseudorhodoferax soli]RCW76445.1 uncharacterized protein DUF4157 [Pseudorhodoferax soli]
MKEAVHAERDSAQVLQERARRSAGAADPLRDSPRLVAQRARIDAAFGAVAQKAGGLEDEEPLQARMETAAPQNETGMPNQLKAGIESLSGMDMSDVRVHRNSDRPAQLNALAYAQGNDIHLGPGQEQHLPHEAWHVAQQAQGRVRPTVQLQGGVGVNDEAALEAEADAMGERARGGFAQRAVPDASESASMGGAAPVQREVKQNTAPWGIHKDKWYTTLAPHSYFATKGEAEAHEAGLQQQQAQQVLLAQQQAQQAWQAVADVQAWNILPSARGHYADGWGQAYGITNDGTLCQYIEDYVADGGEANGVNTIEMGTFQNSWEHISKTCTVAYEVTNRTVTVGNITDVIWRRRVFHCGPSNQGS